MNDRPKTATINLASAWNSPVQRSNAGGGAIRVFIADDERFARGALAMLLRNETDFQVVGRAGDGIETLRAIQNMRVDVLFLDVNMPGMGGIEVLERAGCRKDLAVIFTTSDEKIGARAYDLNALDYLLKPYSRARFKLALDRARAWFRGNRLSPCVLDRVTG